jgi:hypothetical protein
VTGLERNDTTTERAEPAPRQVWFRIEEVEIRWLPCGEVAFLLWVLVLLLAAWLGLGVALGVV